MYPIVIVAHSWVRWIVLLAALVALVRAIGGMQARRPWTVADDRSALYFTAALDLQFLLGLALLGALGAAAGSRRVLEHAVGMIVAVALAHVGRVRVRRQKTSEDRHRTWALFITLSLLAILFSIPWAAPWFRL